MSRMDEIERGFSRKTTPQVRVGDTVDVHVLIR